ncbi:MAG: transporter substrate-binding domain-containing protein [Verrucomicrobiaceae bacterium]|nr:transporter substrate-binding domain-containing protein [Verrucomicrobiaceae bacterium]
MKSKTDKGQAKRWMCSLVLVAGLTASIPAQEEIPASEKTSLIKLTPKEAAWLKTRRVIRYGADPSWPPFSLRTGETLEGIDADLIEIFAARLGVPFEYVPTKSWEETMQKLARGEIDFVSGFANLPERPAEVLYTRPYATFPVVTIMRNDGPFYTSFEQIEREGLTLAMPAGYAPTIYIKEKFPGIPLLFTETSVEALQRVSDGSADVALENLGVAAHLIRFNGLLNLKISGPTRLEFDPTFGASANLPELRSILDSLLDSVSKQEQLSIYEKWILVDISRMWSVRKVLLVFGLIFGLAALLLGLASASNRRLARELKKRREVEDSLRQSEERFRHLFERMDHAYFLTTSEGKIQFVNETAVEMLGIGSRPVIERLSLDAFLQSPGEWAEVVDGLHSGGKVSERTVTFIRADGSTVRGQCRIHLLGGKDEHDDLGIEWFVQPLDPSPDAGEP